MHSHPAARILPLPALVLAASWLAGCANTPPTLVPVHDALLDDPARVARLNERAKNPLLLRGVDGQPLKTLRTPASLRDYDYVLKAGRHSLWLKSMPYGYPPVPQRLRCYVIVVELAGGMRYRLKEDLSQKRALLLRADTGEQIATGPMVDEPWVFSRECRWPSP
ncbi:MAG TPA: hypothetical protein VIN36_05575 [Thiobacillus sp.]